MRDYLLISLVGGLAVFNSLFLGVMFLANHRGQLKNKLLGLLFLSLSIRVGKSLLIVWLHDVPDSIPAIGLLGMVATGPLLYFYILQCTVPSQTPEHRDYLHFFPALLIGALLPFSNDRMVLWLYVIVTVQLFIYIAMAGKRMRKLSMDDDIRRWLMSLSAGVTVIALVYASQIVIETRIAYIVATLLATVVLYTLMFLAFQKQRPFMPEKVMRQPDEKLSSLARQLVTLMEKDQVYRDTDLTIATLAARLRVKPYLISQVMGVCIRKTFPEWVNEYRVREAERLLRSPQFSHYSIQGIGFESGFSTPSAFYSVFKKRHGITPSAFKERQR